MTARGLRPRSTRVVVTGLTAAALATTALTTAAGAPAVAAPQPCPTAFPTADLTVGQEVQGLTVTRGTEPEGFTGEISGVLEDGIAPGVDMILADLTSPAIDRSGIWSGMSGSPVYADAEQTQLIGAVSYGLNEGNVALAGITPAADMLQLTEGEPAESARLSPAVTRRLTAAGVATRSQLSSGLRQLPVPVAVSGLSSSRFTQLGGWLDRLGPVTRAAGSGASATSDAEDIVAGGNVAASLGYGYIGAAAVGTVTQVCDGKVTAFGHPFTFEGDVTHTMHSADTVAVVPGSTFAGYKLANLGAPVGTFSGDHLAAITGRLGAAPKAYDVTSTATYRSRSVTGKTHVTVPEYVADLGLENAFAVSDDARARWGGKGGARASWTITGKRRNGQSFTLRNSDVYASSSDIAAGPVIDMAMQLFALVDNETEAVTIESITTSTSFTDDATQWKVGPAYTRTKGAWKRVTGKAPVVVRAGKSKLVRVELYSRDADSRFVTVPVTAPRKAAGKGGRLTLEGGFAGDDDFYFFDGYDDFMDYWGDDILGGSKPSTIPQVLSKLSKAQKNDAVATSFRVRGMPAKAGSISLGQVVSGRTVVPVRVRR